MTRATVYCLCEGYSERNLVERLLAPELGKSGVDIHPVVVMTRRDKKAGKTFKGGGSFEHYKADLRRLYRTHGSRPNTYFTTLIDVYAAPAKFRVEEKNAGHKVERMEDALRAVAVSLGIPDHQFISHFALHEFETLLLVDVVALNTLFLEFEQPLKTLAKEIASLGDVESINDTKTGAPSKRIEKYIPSYKRYKRSEQNGAINVLELVGLRRLRDACPHFDAWITRLETLTLATSRS